MITDYFFKQWIKNIKRNNKEVKWKTIYDALKKNLYFDEYYTCNFNKIKGDLFEYLTKYIYLFDGYKQVYLYNEIPSKLKKQLGLPKNDRGIDLLCSEDGVLWSGIQCKWRTKISKSIDKKYVTEFLYELNDSLLDYGIFFTNVKYITNRFDDIDNLKWSTRSKLLKYVNNDLIKYILNHKNKKNSRRRRRKIKKLRYYQKEAVEKLIKDKSNNKQLILACGTGKSEIGFEYLKRIDFNEKRILLLFPSLQLISQAYERLIGYLGKPDNTLCICSQMDKDSLSCGETSDDSEDKKLMKEFLAMDTKKIYTTDQKIIKKRLRRNKKIVVFCTYQSSKLLKDQSFDVCIFDEAHKTVNNDSFGYLLTDDNCKIKERIYFTATPRYFKGEKDKCISMNNKDIYGEEIYNYTFKQAIDDNYILDFEIVTYTTPAKLEDIMEQKYVKKDNLDVDANCIISAIQLAQHIKKYDTSKKILTYHNTVNNAHKFKKTLNYIFDKFDLTANIFVMSGKTKISNRYDILNEFNESNIGIICSSKVLNEGVNIPHVDTIMFVEPRRSTIDVTQCVGRGMRLYKDLDKCTIIIPIHYNNITNKHNFSPLIKILTAMGEIDNKIIEYFIKKRRNNKIVVRNMNVTDWIDNDDEVKYSVDDIIESLKTRVMSSTQLGWTIKKNIFFKYCKKYNKIPVKGEKKYKGINLATWFHYQKSSIKKGNQNIYDILIVYECVKKELDYFLDPYNKINEMAKFLFEYCNENKRIPNCTIKHDGRGVARWLELQKEKIKKGDEKLYKILSKNKYVRESIKNYLDPDRIFNQKKKIFLRYCNKNKCVPKKLMYKGTNLYNWFAGCRTKINSEEDELYKTLSVNKCIKENIDNYLIKKEKNKGKKKLTEQEKLKLLFEYSNKFKKAPTKKLRYGKEDCGIGFFLANKKRIIKNKDDEQYKILSKNKYIKASLDACLKRRERKKFTIEEKFSLLFDFADKNKSFPKRYEEYEKCLIGDFFSRQKSNITEKDDETYKKLTSNKYIKKGVDEYLEKYRK